MSDLKNYGLPKEDKHSAADYIVSIVAIVIFFIVLFLVN